MPGVRRVGDSLVSLQQGEAALETIQNSTRQLDDDVKDGSWLQRFQHVPTIVFWTLEIWQLVYVRWSLFQRF